MTEKTKSLLISYHHRNEIIEFLNDLELEVNSIDDLIYECGATIKDTSICMGRILEKMQSMKNRANIYCEVLEGLGE